MHFEITEPIEKLSETLDRLEEDIRTQFAETDDIDYGRFLIEKLDRIEEFRKFLDRFDAGYNEVLAELNYNAEAETSRGEDGLRCIRTEVSDGMINQSILALTEARKRGVVKVGEWMEIELPSGERFKTQIVSPGNRLRERGRIREFYRSEKVEEGDHVVLEEKSEGVWKLGICKSSRLSPEQLDGLLRELLDDTDQSSDSQSLEASEGKQGKRSAKR